MSFAETLVILLVAVIVLGPKRLPAAARKLGHWMGVLRRASDEFKRQLMTMDQAAEDTLNSSTGELDHLLPSDEEWNQATDFSVEAPEEENPEQALGAPPSSSPDDALDEPPVSGGLLPEKPVDEVPAPPPAEQKAEVSNAEKAQEPEPVQRTEAAPAEEVRRG